MTCLLMWLVVGKEFQPRQWIAVGLLVTGTILAESSVEEHILVNATVTKNGTYTESGTARLSALGGIIFLAVCVSFANVWTEWLYKR